MGGKNIFLFLFLAISDIHVFGLFFLKINRIYCKGLKRSLKVIGAHILLEINANWISNSFSLLCRSQPFYMQSLKDQLITKINEMK